MKILKRFLLFSLLLLSIGTTSIAAEETEKATATAGRASYVFHSYTALINRAYFGGECALLGRGNGSIKITLQRQDSVNGWWFTYDRQTYTKNFSNTSVCAFTKEYTLPAGNTFRCKTVVNGTLDGHEDTKDVISPELTVY